MEISGGDDGFRGGKYRDLLIVAGLTIISMITVGGLNSSLGVILEPLRANLQWSSSEVSALPCAMYLTAAFGALLGGRLLRCVSPRIVMTAGVVVIACGLYLASLTATLPLMLLAFACIGLGYGTGTLVACYYVAAQCLRFNMSITMSFFLFGMAIGTTLVPIQVSFMIDTLGWRDAFVLLAVAGAAVTLPVTLFIMPKHRPLEAQADKPDQRDAPDATPMPKRRLGLVLSAQLLFSICAMGIYIHYVGILHAHGISLRQSTLYFSSTGIISVVSPFALGWIARRSGTLSAFFIGCSLNIVGVILLYYAGAHAFGSAILATILWGSSSITSTQLTPVLIHDVIPDNRVSTALGISAFIDSISSGIGPLVVGSFADLDPSYNMVLIGIVATLCLCFVPLCLLGKMMSLMSNAARSFVRARSSRTGYGANS